LPFELRPQIQLVGFRLLQLRPVVVPDEHVPSEGDDRHKAQADEEACATAQGQRPTSRGSRLRS